MILNDTCVPGNETSVCSGSAASVGLAAGLTIFFLLLVMVAGVILYKYRSSIRAVSHLGHKRSQKKKGCAEIPEADSHQYTVMSRQQSRGQTPIYENLTTRTKNNSCTVNQGRLLGDPEEDLYLQCDLPDDAIYSNDPTCNLSILSDSQEDNLYIVPDS